MDRSAVAVNYAAALLELAEREGALDEYASLIHVVADTYRDTPEFRSFLETPRVSLDDKKSLVRKVFGDSMPELFLRYLLVVIEKRRFRLLPEIDLAYREQVDEKEGRVRASVTLAHPADAALRQQIGRQLSELFDREVIAKILRHIGEGTEAPAVLPARGPPQGAFEFDQTAVSGEWVEVDQTLGLADEV